MTVMTRPLALGALRAGLVVAVGLTVATGALAQAADSDAFVSRISLAAGLGHGNLTQGCSFAPCPVPFGGDHSWMLRLGYHDGQAIFGLEYDHWDRIFDATTSSTYTWVGPSLQWFPFEASPLKGLYLRGLLARATLQSQPGGPHNLGGLGYGAGAGFDVHVYRGLVLAPYWDILGADRAEMSSRTIGRDGRPIATKIWYSAVLRTFGVALRLDGL